MGNVNMHFTWYFTLAIIILAVGITTTHCNRSCVSCRKSFTHCNKTTGVCNSNCARTKLCRRQDDLCLATWHWKGNKLIMFTSCFPLPPFSNSSHYKARCESAVLNGTRTCLCRGNDCNRNPMEPVRNSEKQALSSAKPKLLHQKRNLTEDFSKRKVEREPKPLIQKKSSKDTSTITWISLAAVLISVLIAGLINRLRKCKDHIDTKLIEVVEDSPLSGLDTQSAKQSAGVSELVTLERVLFQGRYATVWKGRVKEQLVAVKVYPQAAISSWKKERAIYDLLSGEHSNITKLIHKETLDRTNDSLWLIMDFYENGSLRQYLQKKVLSWSEAINLTNGIINGVAFLHSEIFQDGRTKVAVAHRDLKSTNILVRKDGTSVISDFGLALSLSSVEDESKKMQVGTYRYMSPEELLTTVDLDSTETFKQMDIYSMALVLWEIISRCEVSDFSPGAYQLPFAEMVGTDATFNDMVEVVALKQYRPQLPCTDHKGLKVICQTVQECWDPDPEARLTADCAQLRLKELLLMTQ